MKNQPSFGEHLKNLRQKNNLTLNRLAVLAGMSPSYLSRIERGERSVPNAGILKKIAPHLGLTPEELMRAAGYLDPNSAVKGAKGKGQEDPAKNLPELVKDPFLTAALQEVTPLDHEEKEGLLLYLKAIKLRREQKNE